MNAPSTMTIHTHVSTPCVYPRATGRNRVSCGVMLTRFTAGRKNELEVLEHSEARGPARHASTAWASSNPTSWSSPQ
jgi:hypothetical protein